MTSIDTLPDDVLLKIFNLHLYDEDIEIGSERQKAWQTLVHVCRRWRSIVFGSPHHLNLQLVCTPRNPARNMLDVWPALPLIVVSDDFDPAGRIENILAALERTDRVCQIDLKILWGFHLDMLLVVMQQPFPELTHLHLLSHNKTVSVVDHDSFLGGSAPRLKYLHLEDISFPGLLKLLLSATHLVDLRFINIPHSGYISPERMVAALSTLTSLEYLSVGFESPRSCPDPASRRPPPSTRSVLPVLTYFQFRGVSEYLDDLVACIDAPQLDTFEVTLFNDIVFDAPQLFRFISHTPMSKALETAKINFQHGAARVKFSSETPRYREFNVGILCKGLNWQASFLEQICTSYLPLLSILEDLYIDDYFHWKPDWKDSIENGQWLEFFRLFVAVKSPYLSEKVASSIAPALQELVEGRTTDVLPALQTIFLKKLKSSGSVQESIGQFVAARQVANHPIVISLWT